MVTGPKSLVRKRTFRIRPMLAVSTVIGASRKQSYVGSDPTLTAPSLALRYVEWQAPLKACWSGFCQAGLLRALAAKCNADQTMDGYGQLEG